MGLTPRKIYEHLDRYVIGQHEAKRTVATAAYNHFKRIHHANNAQKQLIRRSNILMIGPTGCGKTHIARNLAEILDVPLAICDATEYTEAGYYGKDAEVMVAELLYQVAGDIELAQNGVIFIDEIDKIARKSNGARNGAAGRDIGGEGVQQALLKVLDGKRMFVPLNVTQHWNRHDFVEMDTQNILFICAGTFSDLRPEFDSGQPIGFESEAEREARKALRRPVSTKELVDYGFLHELLGRLPVIVQLDALRAEDLITILRDPPDSILREYTEVLAMDDVTLETTEDALLEMARYAQEQRVGARGLRSIMERVLADILFEAPEREGQTARIDADFVRERLADFMLSEKTPRPD
ncbi:MAG: ATP-dependent Clp protease ATP-binding subunit ClpX [Chrysiogenetes bacterium]|nr:ATP-dependent Clp protease ATP-binding subunit ClpX [Chrysiogenetes bacterium]